MLHTQLSSHLFLQNGSSPLHVASFNGHLEVVKTLTEAGANVNQANKVDVLEDYMYPLLSL